VFKATLKSAWGVAVVVEEDCIFDDGRGGVFGVLCCFDFSQLRGITSLTNTLQHKLTVCLR